MNFSQSCQNPCSAPTTCVTQQECCPPSEYNPITVSTSPTVQGGAGGPSHATGGNNSVSLSVNGGCGFSPQVNNQPESQDCCCKYGIKSVLLYLQSLALDALTTPDNPDKDITLLAIFGNVANGINNSNALVATTSNDDVANAYFSNDIVYINKQAISLCAISYISFSIGNTDKDALNLQVNLKKQFDNYIPSCNCDCGCDCSVGIGNYLFNKRFISGANVTITLKDVFTFTGNITSGYLFSNYSIIGNIVALSSNFVIIRNTNTTNSSTDTFFAVSLCNVAKVI